MKAHLEYYRMAYFRGLLIWFVGFQVTLQTSAANINFTSLDWFAKIMLLLGAAGGGCGALAAFLDKTMAGLDAGKQQQIVSQQPQNG